MHSKLDVLMALDVSCDKDLSELGNTSQAAEQHLTASGIEELCDKIYESFSTNILKCHYFDISKNSQINMKDNNSLSIIYLNIRSLNKNFDKLYDFLLCLTFTPDVLCLSESRIKKQPLVNINLSGYSFVNVDPVGNAGDVAMYVRKDLKITQEQNIHLCGCESLWLTLYQPNTNKKLTIATIYMTRVPPSRATDKFVEDFSNCLEKLAYEKKTFYILGDININIYGNNLSVQAKNYINAIACNEAYSIITQPTRIMANSATLIDHAITNDIAHTISPSIILNDMTDHYPLLCNIRKFKTTNSRMNTILYYRDKKIFAQIPFVLS